jgi:hypothetical protein
MLRRFPRCTMTAAVLGFVAVSPTAIAAGRDRSSPFSTSLMQTIHQVVDLIPMAMDERRPRDVKQLNQALFQLLLVLERRPVHGGAMAAGMNWVGPQGRKGVNGGNGAKGNGGAVGGMVGQKGKGKGREGMAANQAAAGKAVGGMVGQKRNGNPAAGGKDAAKKVGALNMAPVGGMIGQKGNGKVGLGKGAGGKAGQGGAMLGKQGKNGNGRVAVNPFAGMQMPQIAAAGAFGRGMGQVHPQANKKKR